jgi:hypothetical protein
VASVAQTIATAAAAANTMPPADSVARNSYTGSRTWLTTRNGRGAMCSSGVTGR